MTFQQIMFSLQFGNKAMVPKWARKCREVAVQMCFGLSEPIDKQGVIVEIDELKFGNVSDLIFQISNI